MTFTINNIDVNEIESICKYYGIANYTINQNGLVDVDGDVNLSYSEIYHKFTFKSSIAIPEDAPARLEKLPISFGYVTGDFNCSGNDLTALDGSPTVVGGSFYCEFNRLPSLLGGPISVGNCFYCDDNLLTSLEGSPELIGGLFCFSDNLVHTTYSGDIDIEVSGNIIYPRNRLTLNPFYDDNIFRMILKYQRHFFIWNDDLTLNEENFQILLDEINDGLE